RLDRKLKAESESRTGFSFLIAPWSWGHGFVMRVRDFRRDETTTGAKAPLFFLHVRGAEAPLFHVTAYVHVVTYSHLVYSASAEACAVKNPTVLDTGRGRIRRVRFEFRRRPCRLQPSEPGTWLPDPLDRAPRSCCCCRAQCEDSLLCRRAGLHCQRRFHSIAIPDARWSKRLPASYHWQRLQEWLRRDTNLCS